jgi:adenylylsulfate kinase-like enzyme
MLVHISGPSGSGKSFLATQLRTQKKKNTLIVDTDDIDDAHALQLIAQPKYRKFLEIGQVDKVFREKDKLNREWIKKEVTPLLKKGWTVILVGLSFGMIKSANKKYVIMIKDKEELYRRVYLRTLEDILAHGNDIRKLFKSGTHPEIIKLLCLHKYKIRQDFIGPYYPSLMWINKFYVEHNRAGYQALSQGKILEHIQKLKN